MFGHGTLGPSTDEDVDADVAELRLGVLENAHDFIEESLRFPDRATVEPKAWKFAIVLCAQGIELLLKARLANEHPLLVKANIDRPESDLTVSAEIALKRLAGWCADRRRGSVRLLLARRLRNQFIHYEVNATVEQLEAAFADLLEFV